MGVKCPGCWISLCDLLKAPLTRPFLEASGNRVSDFGAKEIREQTEAVTTAKLLVPRCDLAPVLHPSSLEFSVNLPRGEWGVEGSTSKAESVIGKHGTVEGEGRKAECGGQNIWGSVTNA